MWWASNYVPHTECRPFRLLYSVCMVGSQRYLPATFSFFFCLVAFERSTPYEKIWSHVFIWRPYNIEGQPVLYLIVVILFRIIRNDSNTFSVEYWISLSFRGVRDPDINNINKKSIVFIFKVYFRVVERSNIFQNSFIKLNTENCLTKFKSDSFEVFV